MDKLINDISKKFEALGQNAMQIRNYSENQGTEKTRSQKENY